MLGTIDQGALHRILEALAGSDGPGLLACAQDLAAHAADFSTVLGDLLRILHDLAVAQVVPEALAGAEADQAQEAVRALAARIPPEDVQLYYQIALTGVRELPYAPDMRIAFEMTLLRMLAFQPEEGDGQGGAPDGGTSKAAPDPAPQAPPGTEALRGMLADTPSVTPASAFVAPEPVPPEPGPAEPARDLAPEPAPVQPAPARQALSGALAGLDEPAAEAAAPATKPDPDPDPDHEAPREAKFEPEIPGRRKPRFRPTPSPSPYFRSSGARPFVPWG